MHPSYLPMTVLTRSAPQTRSPTQLRQYTQHTHPRLPQSHLPHPFPCVGAGAQTQTTSRLQSDYVPWHTGSKPKQNHGAPTETPLHCPICPQPHPRPLLHHVPTHARPLLRPHHAAPPEATRAPPRLLPRHAAAPQAPLLPLSLLTQPHHHRRQHASARAMCCHNILSNTSSSQNPRPLAKPYALKRPLQLWWRPPLPRSSPLPRQRLQCTA